VPHISLQQAILDFKTQLDVWAATCPRQTGGPRHPTSHPQTHACGTGYTGASAAKPATILKAEWDQLDQWWKALAPVAGHNKWTTRSAGSTVPDVWDLCCACTNCPPISVRDFNSPTQFSMKPPTFVYHLQVVQIVPPLAITIKASSNHADDSLELDYKIVRNDVLLRSGKLNKFGKVDVTLPAGVKADDCRFGFQGLPEMSFKIDQASLLPGGRYMITIIAC